MQHTKDKHESNTPIVHTKKPFNKKWIYYAGVVIIILIIYLFVKASDVEYIPVLPDSDNVKGNESATVTIIEYSDFQCPVCKRFWETVLPELDEKYISTGKVKMIYRHFPIKSIHAYAVKSAEASECAADQGKFWEYHDKLFSGDSLTRDYLNNYAEEIGLDLSKFNDCLDSGVMRERVELDLRAGLEDGVTGTPSFFINGKPISGLRPFEVYETAIEEALESSE